jgi:addiction module HigA family antidote
MNSYIQHNPSHPGEILLELYLKPLNLSVTAASEQLLISRPRLSDIINGRAGISASMALKLSKAFKTSPQLWLNLQANFDLWQANQDNEEVKRVKVLVD